MSSFASTIRLLSNVPLDKNHDNTMTFPNSDAQQTYFSGKTVHSMFNCSYQREQMSVRVDAEYDRIVNCNYLMYQNQEFSNKWFYAFITQIEYKNDDLSVVHFEIDSYQSFMFDVTIHPSFVEREHVNNDAVGANLIDEGLACGDYVTNTSNFINLNNWCVVVASTVDLEDDAFLPIMGNYNDKIFSGCAYYGFSTSGDIIGLNIVLDKLAKAGKLDAIVQAFMFPISMVPSGAPHFERLDTIMSPRILYPSVPYVANLNGYVPKNNKLFTAPYKSCVISATTGGSISLPYEFFTGEKQIAYGTMITPNGGILIWARNFKGIQNNYDYHITLTDFPTCTWLGNSYANWNAVQSIRSNYSMQNATVNHALGTAKGAVNNLASGNAVGAAMGAVNSVVDYAQDVYTIASNMQEEREIHSLVPMVANGQTTCSPLIAVDAYGIMMEDRSITADYAKSIDNFWSVYGYKVNKVKTPNITGRPSWNYVKTSNAIVTGGAPVEHLSNIKNMLNRGVTFWHGDFVGDYSRDNSTGQTPPEPEYNYTLNVIGGTGAGQYKGNTQVAITADEPTKFKNWSSNGGGTFADPNLATTVYTMPFNNVTITANYNTPQPTENLADYAMQFLGAVEWDDTVRLWQTWYYGNYVKDAWCTTFTTYCANMIGKGAQVPKNAAVQSLYNQMNSKGTTWQASVGGKLPKRGDICFFITSQSSTTLHHCGIVTNMHSDGVTFDYVSGNTSNPTAGKPDGVFVKTTKIGKTTPSYVKYFGEVN